MEALEKKAWISTHMSHVLLPMDLNNITPNNLQTITTTIEVEEGAVEANAEAEAAAAAEEAVVGMAVTNKKTEGEAAADQRETMKIKSVPKKSITKKKWNQSKNL